MLSLSASYNKAQYYRCLQCRTHSDRMKGPFQIVYNSVSYVGLCRFREVTHRIVAPRIANAGWITQCIGSLSLSTGTELVRVPAAEPFPHQLNTGIELFVIFAQFLYLIQPKSESVKFGNIYLK